MITINCPFIMISNHDPKKKENAQGVMERLFVVKTKKLNITWPLPPVEFDEFDVQNVENTTHNKIKVSLKSS